MIHFKDKVFHVLCVDDTPTNLLLVKNILDKNGYKITTVQSGAQALSYLKSPHNTIDIILLDIMMPEMDGYELCRILKKSSLKLQKIPIIFLTAINDMEGVSKGFDVGGVDYITKPFRPKELLARLNTHLKLRFFEAQKLQQTELELVFMMSTLADKHCEETAGHVERVAEYSKLLAKLLGYGEEQAELIKKASAMHDIGKVTTPDHILHKPSKHTDAEFLIMKEHAQAGYEILHKSKLPLMQIASIIAHQHHEKWDGSGYPRALKGKEIHILGRIVALADVLDALSSSRKYKKGWDLDAIFSFLKSQRGKHFDPRMVDLFMDNFGLFLEIRDKYTSTT
ncbi:response regulator [Sulfurimonas sp. MAG313]|nr:HD domain-containing phosphohydrolase [Sulfurimonas sp. MAG313]MDF1881637.1 response regulator [Sulfurimonas sp. MAG313]